ncbi:MAG: ABC transporter ATP-binding protein [Acidimicrobiia bacterium]|nr:MAG: ABC transporter ATP-binding protein [Acidimicrobiia bacterium]
MTDSGLLVANLSVAYAGSVTALRGVSLRVPRGSIVTVLGANGAGKTTLVRAVTGLLFVHDGKIREGTITFNGKPIHTASATAVVKHGICQVPEGRMLFPRLTAEENLLCGAATRRRSPEIDLDLERVYQLFPVLGERRRQPAGLLSGGEQQMLAVGRALMARPRLLICDELSLGLAPMVVAELFRLLRQLNETEEMSILVIEQNARVALENSHYGYVLETGQMVVEGDSGTLRADPHVQELYLGGAGEAKAAYQALVRQYRNAIA